MHYPDTTPHHCSMLQMKNSNLLVQYQNQYMRPHRLLNQHQARMYNMAAQLLW
jgi:hypothetical protein